MKLRQTIGARNSVTTRGQVRHLRMPTDRSLRACGVDRHARGAKRGLVRLLATVALAVSAAAGSAAESVADYDGAITITLENDAFTGSDNNYTNGIGVSWVSTMRRIRRSEPAPHEETCAGSLRVGASATTDFPTADCRTKRRRTERSFTNER